MDVLPPYGSLTTINEKTDFLRTDGGNFYALYESLTTTHEKMYLLRKRSLYFSQLRDSIAPGSILMASYVFFHRNIRCHSPWSGPIVPFPGRVICFPTETEDAPLIGVVLPSPFSGELCFIFTEPAGVYIIGVGLPKWEEIICIVCISEVK